MCCLGFACHQLGVSIKDLNGVGLPSFLSLGTNQITLEVALSAAGLRHRSKASDEQEWDHWSSPDWIGRAVRWNDAEFAAIAEALAGDPIMIQDLHECQRSEGLGPEQARELALTRIFAGAGHEIVFTDDFAVYSAYLDEVHIEDRLPAPAGG